MVRAFETPQTPAEAAAILAEAHGTHTPVAVIGGGSRRHWWRNPASLDEPDAGVTVSALGLGGEPDIHAANLTATFPAGMPLRRVHERLAEEGLWLPLMHVESTEATLGGCVAAGFVNPLRLGYGLTRDCVLGLQVVSPQGRVLTLGSELVKNVAGYDLVRLHLGAWGRLGLLARVTVRLLPLPEASVLAEARWEYGVDSVAVVDEWLRAVLTDGTQPASLEVSAGPGRELRVLADFVGPEVGVSARAGAHAWGALHVADARAAAWESQVEENRAVAAALPWRARVSVEVPGLRRLLPAVGAVGGDEWYLRGHAGSGVYYFSWQDERGPIPGLEALVRELSRGSGGDFSVVAEGAAAALVLGTAGWVGFPPRPPRSQDAVESALVSALSGGRPLNPHLPLAVPARAVGDAQ